MMGDVYVLNQRLEIIGLIDSYKSLIWANRYKEVGDCELYVPASVENLRMLQINNYLFRLEDDMVCQIKKIQLDTDPENGNYLSVTGYDVKSWLDQRIIYGTMSTDGNLETFIRTMVNSALGSAADSDRQIKDADGNLIFGLGSTAGFTKSISTQASYRNVGEKVRDYCTDNGWGYKVIFDSTIPQFQFVLYAGADRSASVMFSGNFENLRETTYIEDHTNMGNFAVIAGEGEGTARVVEVAGASESLSRYEIYVDARDLSKTITYGDLRALYPLVADGGTARIWQDGLYYYYVVRDLYVRVYDDRQLAELQRLAPSGHVEYIDGNKYYYMYDRVVADLLTMTGTGTIEDTDNVRLRDFIYSTYLLNRGYEDLSEYGATTSFEGSIEPNTTFVFKEDYFLGDIVTVENEYGISVEARIVEIVEVCDDTGYYVEPKFEYIQED